MQKRIQLNVFLGIIILTSCSGGEIIRNISEYLTESDNYIYWDKAQTVPWRLFKGESDESGNSSSAYFGIICRYRAGKEKTRFDIQAYFDKKKSYTLPKSSWKNEKLYALSPQYYKIKFDFYEYDARTYRKHLIEFSGKITAEEIRKLAKSINSEIAKEWEAINNEYQFPLDERKLQYLREVTDQKLTLYAEYGSETNNY